MNNYYSDICLLCAQLIKENNFIVRMQDGIGLDNKGFLFKYHKGCWDQEKDKSLPGEVFKVKYSPDRECYVFPKKMIRKFLDII